MKAVFILLLAVTAVMAEQSKFRNQLSSLLNIQSKAADAIDSALQLLRDLKQANVDAQEEADEVNRTTEAELGSQIDQLLYIADVNKAAGNDATTYRKHIEGEIQTTHEYLVWITNRRQEIIRKRGELIDQRCYSSLMFVKQLKEHDEALEVIKWLKEDVLGIITGETPIELNQLRSSASKLAAYAHLFNDAAMKEFNQLTQGPQAVDPSTGEWDSRATDNERSSLDFNRMEAGTGERDIGNKLYQAIEKLEQHLKDSMEDLKTNEIRAAWDLVAWLNDSEKELDHLDAEEAAKNTYLDKMLIAIIGAKAHEDKQWEIYFESAATYNNAVADREGKRDIYASEKARREEENAALDEVIKMFIDQVSTLNSGMRNKVETGEDLKRRTDDAYSKDFGKLAGNVASESRAF